MVYNHGIESMDMWEEASWFFLKGKNKTEHVNMTKFYTDDKFGLLIDLRSMADQAMHGSGTPREHKRRSPAGNQVEV